MTETRILDGTKLAEKIRVDLTVEIARLKESGTVPRAAVVLASSDTAVASYVQSKVRSAQRLGINLRILDLGPECTQERLEQTLFELSHDPTTHGVLLELPLAPGLNSDFALDQLAPVKDIDGMTAVNLGRIAAGRADVIAPATPQACIELTETFTSLARKVVGVVGRGRTVGRPLVSLLLNRDATPIVCHTRTPDLAAALKPCDIVIVAAGKPQLIGSSALRSGQVVVDAGINVVDSKVVGDVDAEAARQAGVAALSPVPGGVGPVTTAIVFRNLIKAIHLQTEGLSND